MKQVKCILMKQLHTFLVLVVCLVGRLAAQPNTTLQLHPKNPHYFLYQNKATVLIGSGEHYGSVINLDFDYKKYLQTIAADGLNTTRLFMGAYIEKLGDFGIQKNTLAPKQGRLLLPWKRSGTGGYILGGNKFDLSNWDEAYFLRLADFMSDARRNGVIVEINLFSAHYGSGFNYSALNKNNNINHTDSIPSPLVNTLQNGNLLGQQERYVRKLVQQLNGFGNFYFEIQNEPWADQTDTLLARNEYSADTDWRTRIQVVSQRSNNWQRQVAKWITEEEASLPNKHLIAQNISNFYYPITRPDPNISIFNFHYAMPDAVGENYHLNKVIGFNETGFAGKLDITYRRQAWRFMMAGGALFNHLDYSFWPGSETGQDTDFVSPGGGSMELRKQFGILKQFFYRLDFVQLKPDYGVVKAAPGAATKALSNSSNQWVIYYEPMALLPQQLILQLPTAKYKATWSDVLTGEVLQTSNIINQQIMVPAKGGDKVLVINKMK